MAILHRRLFGEANVGGSDAGRGGRARSDVVHIVGGSQRVKTVTSAVVSPDARAADAVAERGRHIALAEEGPDEAVCDSLVGHDVAPADAALEGTGGLVYIGNDAGGRIGGGGDETAFEDAVLHQRLCGGAVKGGSHTDDAGGIVVVAGGSDIRREFPVIDQILKDQF